MSIRFGIGTSDFVELRQEQNHFVDKSGFVTQIVTSSTKAFLFPRPRRFGKTLNISMLKTFVEARGASDAGEDHRKLFDGLAIEAEGDEVWRHFQRYPAIFLSFKNAKATTWEDTGRLLLKALHNEVRRLSARWGAVPETILACVQSATVNKCATLLGDISIWLHEVSGEKVVLLVDEYDAAIHSAWVHGFYDEAIGFFRTFFSAGFKDNSHLFKGVITGILRIAKESIFSGLNNLAVYTLLDRQFSTEFGFREDEVEALVAHFESADLDTIREWYNGYRFGVDTIYNPWSVINYLSRLGDGPKPYWLNTSSNDLIYQLLTRGPGDIHQELMRLIGGESITKPIEEALVLRELEQTTSAVWSLLLFSGYLRPERQLPGPHGGLGPVELAIPNYEVGQVFTQSFEKWMQEGLGSDESVDQLCRALLAGDMSRFERRLSRLFQTMMSYHDLNRAAGSESVYQSFILGLLVRLRATHVVTSNRESGYGRYDIMIEPRDSAGVGVVMELKVLDARRKETPEQGLVRAKEQMVELGYATVLEERGVAVVRQVAVVFDGKEVWAEAM